VTTCLSRLNLNIGSAHIVTWGEKAVDAFYVTDLTGRRSRAGRQAALKRQMLAVLAGSRRRLIFCPELDIARE